MDPFNSPFFMCNLFGEFNLANWQARDITSMCLTQLCELFKVVCIRGISLSISQNRLLSNQIDLS